MASSSNSAEGEFKMMLCRKMKRCAARTGFLRPLNQGPLPLVGRDRVGGSQSAGVRRWPGVLARFMGERLGPNARKVFPPTPTPPHRGEGLNRRLCQGARPLVGRGVSAAAARILAVGLLAVTLGACRHAGEGVTVAHVAVDPSERHPILVSKRAVHLDVEAPRGSMGLTRAQADHVRAFLREYRAQGQGGLQIAAPSGAANEVAAMRTVRSVRALMRAEGVRPGAVRTVPYYGEGDPQPPVKISFLRYVAEAPECRDWSTNLAESERNLPYPNMGCATQRNLAAMIANPRDLVEPRGLSARPSERRDAQWKKFVKGEPTIAPRHEEEKLWISNVARN